VALKDSSLFSYGKQWSISVPHPINDIYTILESSLEDRYILSAFDTSFRRIENGFIVSQWQKPLSSTNVRNIIPIQANATFIQTTGNYTELNIHYKLNSAVFTLLKITPIVCATVMLISIFTVQIQTTIIAFIGAISSLINLFIWKQRANHQAFQFHCDIKEILNATSL
jgi:hypothetical protein